MMPKMEEDTKVRNLKKVFYNLYFKINKEKSARNRRLKLTGAYCQANSEDRRKRILLSLFLFYGYSIRCGLN